MPSDDLTPSQPTSTPDSLSGTGTVDDPGQEGVTTGPPEDEVEVEASLAQSGATSPELLADSLGDYLRAWRDRIRAGQSGALPILTGLAAIVIIFQVQNSKFLTAGNLVNLFVQATVFVLLGMAEIFVLLLSEIDLSAGYVAAVGAFIIAELIAAPYNWPWWAGILAGLAITAAIGALQGTLITRLRLPSFVVTLAGLLGWQGVMIWLADRDKTAVGGVITISTSSPVYKLVNSNLSPLASWIILIVAVGLYAVATILLHVAAPGPGAQRATAQHHHSHHRGDRGRGRRPGPHMQRQSGRAPRILAGRSLRHSVRAGRRRAVVLAAR